MEIKKQPPAGGNMNAGQNQGNNAKGQTQTGSDVDYDESDEESADNPAMEEGSDDDSRITAMTGNDSSSSVSDDDDDEENDDNVVDTDDMQEGELSNGEEGGMGEDVRK